MKIVEFEIFSKDLTVDAREELERAATVGESIDLMFDDLNEFAQADLLDAVGIKCASDMNWEIVPLDILDLEDYYAYDPPEDFPISTLTLTVCECPNGGDETDDCADCAEGGDYHFCNGECIRRSTVCDGECYGCRYERYEGDDHCPEESI